MPGDRNVKNIASDGRITLAAHDIFKARDANECRRQAEQCFELARTAIADIDASLMSRLGAAFLEAAQCLEGNTGPAKE
jgi:hypothetical protein